MGGIYVICSHIHVLVMTFALQTLWQLLEQEASQQIRASSL